MRPREVIRYTMVSAASLLPAISYCFSMLLWLYITVASVGVIDHVLCLPGMMDFFLLGCAQLCERTHPVQGLASGSPQDPPRLYKTLQDGTSRGIIACTGNFKSLEGIMPDHEGIWWEWERAERLAESIWTYQGVYAVCGKRTVKMEWKSVKCYIVNFHMPQV